MGTLGAPALIARLEVDLESSNWAHFSRGGKHNAYKAFKSIEVTQEAQWVTQGPPGTPLGPRNSSSASG